MWYTGNGIKGSNPFDSAINLPAIFGGLIYGDVETVKNPFGKRKFAGWVRKQVDLINAVQSNRYGFDALRFRNLTWL